MSPNFVGIFESETSTRDKGHLICSQTRGKVGKGAEPLGGGLW